MNARRLEKKLEDFGVEGEVVEILPGPVITMYEYKPAPGVKISKVAGLSDDLALTLRAQSIRIVAPIPGKAAIGIEIPNNQRETVYLQEMLSSSTYTDTKSKLPIALGKDITGSAVVADLAKMPHLLVAGATGTGKSVSLNAMIQSLLYTLTPETARFLMVDPKRIELSVYQNIPHLLHPVVTQPKDANKALRWAVSEMERRYMLLSDRGVRNIDSYNRKVAKQAKKKDPVREGGEENGEDRGTDRHLPYIIIIIDELADLMMVSSKEVEESITRLAQMAQRRRHSPDHRHPASLGQCAHRYHQGQLPHPPVIPGFQQGGLPNHPGHQWCGASFGRWGYAFHAPRRGPHHAHSWRLYLRGRRQRGG